MRLEEAEVEARPLLDEHGLHDWRISLENLRNTDMYGPDADMLGYCDSREKVIRLDWRAATRRDFRQTLLHEIAHALRDASGHDEKWCDIALDVGCSFAHVLPYLLKLKSR